MKILPAPTDPQQPNTLAHRVEVARLRFKIAENLLRYQTLLMDFDLQRQHAERLAETANFEMALHSPQFTDEEKIKIRLYQIRHDALAVKLYELRKAFPDNNWMPVY